jgi:hypothetical protein
MIRKGERSMSQGLRVLVLPVFSIELHPRNYGFVRARFWRKRNVTLLPGDSRAGLRKLFDGPLSALSDLTILFYLDAHWNEELPLSRTPTEDNIHFIRACLRPLVLNNLQLFGLCEHSLHKYPLVASESYCRNLVTEGIRRQRFELAI